MRACRCLVAMLLAAAACAPGVSGGGPGAEPDDSPPGGGGAAPARGNGPTGVPAVDGPQAAPTRQTGDGGAAAAPSASLGRVVFSEIMYHPVLEDGPFEEHEFLELHNRTDQATSIAGFRVVAGKRDLYTFPAGTTIPARGYLVVAKNPAKLAAVSAYRLEAAALRGPYAGELDNGGERLALLDGAGAVIDQVRYDDHFPWPSGADALGAGELWLPPAWRPLTKHKFMGRSLERLSADAPSEAPWNWEASALDGATPGRPSSVAGAPAPLVVALSAAPPDGTARPLRGAEPAVVRAMFAPAPAPGPAPTAAAGVRDLRVEWFVDDPEREDEPRQSAPLRLDGDGTLAMLPGQKEGAIVRYRVRGDRGRGDEVISPRPTDPFAFHGYAVERDLPGKTRAYNIVISTANWTKLWTFITPGRVTGCQPNPNWTNRVPAVLVSEGRVYDVMIRYQGSPYNRLNGATIRTWPAGAGPTQPSPPRALGWRVYLPRYAPLDGGRRALLLHKRAGECGGFTTDVGGRLFESVGIPSSRVSYARVSVNGVPFHYMTELEHPGEDMLKRFYGSDQDVGDLFKVVGWHTDQGPYALADGREIAAGPAGCSYTAAQRYGYNYDRKTPEWKTGSDEMMKLVQDLNAARAQGVEGIRRFFETNFDVARYRDYVALINWMGPFDDFFQNHFFYRRPEGKWIVLPWDFDNVFGFVPSSGSFYVGEFGDRSNRFDLGFRFQNSFKDAFIKAYRDELHARLTELAAGELATERVHKLIDEHAAKYLADEARALPAPQVCNVAAFVTKMKTYAAERNARVRQGLFK